MQWKTWRLPLLKSRQLTLVRLLSARKATHPLYQWLPGNPSPLYTGVETVTENGNAVAPALVAAATNPAVVPAPFLLLAYPKYRCHFQARSQTL
jgi:hypothetical protein